MQKRGVFVLAISALPLASCETVGALNSDHLPALRDGALSKTEIQRCLDVPHKVGSLMISPVPRPGHVFRPGYNFSVKEPDGSYGFGYQQAADGRVTIRYPEHHSVTSYSVARRNGVVYFGSDATSCR